MRRIAATVRSAPLACALVVAVLAAGAVTGTLLHAAEDTVWVPRLAYGLPALADGRWFTLIGGALLVPHPSLYPVVALLLGLAVGFLERRVGTIRCAAVLVVTHLAACLGAAGVLAAAAPLPWPWAQSLATHTDTGMSAGALGVLAAGTAWMSPVVRARVRWAVGGYLALMLLRSGLLWDLEHAIGFAVGLAAGPLVRGRDGAGGPRPDAGITERSSSGTPSPGRAAANRVDADGRVRRLVRIRGAVALLVLLMPASSLVLAVYPGHGGLFGPGTAVPAASPVPALIQFGIALVLAKALYRGLPGAWWAALVFGAVPLGRSLAHLAVAGPTPGGSVHIGDIIAWASVVAVLFGCCRCWPRSLPPVVLRRYAPRLLAATAVFAGVWWLVLTAAGPQFGMHQHGRGRAVLAAVTFTATTDSDARWVHFVLGLSSWTWAATLVALLLPMVLSSRSACRADPAASRRLADLVREHGGGSLGWQRTWPGFAGWTTRAGDVALSYRIVSGVALVLGDPVGPMDRWAGAVGEFRRFCLRAGWTVCFYAVTDAFARRCGSGWHLTHIGEDAVLDLSDLTFRGRSWQDVRTALNHAARAGIRMAEVTIGTAGPEMRAQIEEVSHGWVGSKPLPEMGFTLGTVAHAHDPQVRTHIAVDDAGTVHGVTTWLPVHAGGDVVGWTLDVMRRRLGGFRPTIEFLIAQSALAFRSEGCRMVSLSVAPLARRAAGRRDGAAQPGGDGTGPVRPAGTASEHGGDGPRATPRAGRVDLLLDRAARLLEPVYGFGSLLEFKRKFHPAFSPVYLGYADEMDLSQITLAIGKAYLPHLTGRQAWRVLRTLIRSRRAGRGDPSRLFREASGRSGPNLVAPAGAAGGVTPSARIPHPRTPEGDAAVVAAVSR